MKRRDGKFEVYGVLRCGGFDRVGLKDTVLRTNSWFSIVAVGLRAEQPTIDRTLHLYQQVSKR